MPTVREVNESVKQFQYRRTILKWVVETIDKSFLRNAGGESLKTLLTDDKVKVPEQAFDNVISELTGMIKAAESSTATLLDTEIKEPEPDVTPAEESK